MRSLLCLLVGLAAAACQADPRVGFDVETNRGETVVSRVYGRGRVDLGLSDLRPDKGVQAGDRLVSVAGYAVKKPRDVDAAVKGRKPGRNVTVKVIRGGKPVTCVVPIVESEAVQKEIDDERRASLEAEQEAAKQEQARRQKLLIRALETGPLLFAGQIVDNARGDPEIVLVCENIAETAIEAAKFEVAMFDKFGDPALGIFGSSNEKTFVYQKRIEPRERVVIELRIPWHGTAGKATITAREFVMRGDRKFSPPKPEPVAVRQR